jgi:hypothetical protein
MFTEWFFLVLPLISTAVPVFGTSTPTQEA